MKMSNIILASVICSITLMFTIVIVENSGKSAHAGTTMKTEVVPPADIILDKVELPAFKYLVIKNVSGGASIQPSDRYSIEYVVNKGHKADSSYHVDGDTLIIENLKNESGYMSLTVTMPVKSDVDLKAIESHISILDLTPEKMTLNLDKSQISILMPGINHPVAAKELVVKGVNNSEVIVSSVLFQTADLTLDRSNITFHEPINTLKGSAANYSVLFVKGATELSFKRDSTSTFNFFNN